MSILAIILSMGSEGDSSTPDYSVTLNAVAVTFNGATVTFTY